MIGLWRSGKRYNEPLLKAAVIFFIFPYLNVVAPILVLLGARNAGKRLSVLLS